MYSSGNDAVDKIGMMNIEGNIIPFNWFSEFKFKNGKPDLNAIVILSEIVYWYRPKIIRDEEIGMTVGMSKRFKADLLQRSYDSFSSQFGLTKRQVKDCIDRLCEHGVIYREFRTVQTNATTLFNVLFIGVNAGVLSSVSMYHPPTLERTTPLRLNVPPPTLERNTYTETTTETTNTDTKGYSEAFERFWSEYPRSKRKGSKSEANKTYRKFEKDSDLILSVLQKFKVDQSFLKNDGEFIPAPSVWLNKKHWENDYWLDSPVEADVQNFQQPRPQIKMIRKNYLKV